MKYSILFLIFLTVSCASTQGQLSLEQKEQIKKDTIEVCHGTSKRNLICHQAL